MEESKAPFKFMDWGRDFDHTYASDLYPKIRCFQIFVMYLRKLHINHLPKGSGESFHCPCRRWHDGRIHLR